VDCYVVVEVMALRVVYDGQGGLGYPLVHFVLLLSCTDLECWLRDEWCRCNGVGNERWEMMKVDLMFEKRH